MIDLPYNPFGKKVDDILCGDLEILKDVAEGWYVEYKSINMPVKSIAKSLAAFANHFGGLIFYGIKGAQGTNVAEAFIGLNAQEIISMIENLRNAAKDSINPVPYYEYNILNGPCEKIDLPEGQAILMVIVPSGVNTPYVHGDGRIYRRVADASDPKPETDRFILDQLWERRRKAEDTLTEFLNSRPVVSKDEENIPLLHIFLSQDPTYMPQALSNLEFDDFAQIMSNENLVTNKTLSIALDNCYTASGGFIGRHLFNNKPDHLALTWKHLKNGSSIISVPLHTYSFFVGIDENFPKGYKYSQKFLQELGGRGYQRRTCTILDVNPIFAEIASFITQHKLLVEKGGFSGTIFAKAALEYIWRTIPFLDTENFLNFIQKHGIPVIQDDETYCPPGTNFQSLIKVDYSIQDDQTALASQIIRSAELFAHILRALGVPPKIVFNEENEWVEAVFRSIDIIKNVSDLSNNE